MKKAKLTKAKRNIYLLFSGMLLSLCIMAQPTLTVTPTPSTCLQNGVLDFDVEGENANASVTYTIDDNMGNEVVTTDNQLAGLAPGNYTVTATISESGQTDQNISENAVVEDDFEVLSVDLETIRRCDEIISVEILTGSLETIEILTGPNMNGVIINASGGNEEEITGVVEGDYELLFTDICGNTIQVDHTVTAFTDASVALTPFCNFDQECDSMTVLSRIFDNTIDETPIDYTYIIKPGQPDEEIIVGPQDASTYSSFGVPYYPTENYVVRVEATNACGDVFTSDVNIVSQNLLIFNSTPCDECITLGFRYQRGQDITLEFTNVPDGMDVSTIPNNLTGNCGNPINATLYELCADEPFLSGEYTIEVSDGCQSLEHTFQIADPTVSILSDEQSVSCEDGSNVYQANYSSTIDEATIISAPASYSGPTDLTSCILNNIILVGPLPEGSYTFEATNGCNTVQHEVEIVAVECVVDFNIVPGCNVFNLEINRPCSEINGTSLIRLEHLQNDGTWLQIDVTNDANNGFQNISELGTFRVTRNSNNIGCAGCDETLIESFTYNDDGLNFDLLDGVQCSDGSYTVTAVSTGVAPFDYVVTDSNGGFVTSGTANAAGEPYVVTGLDFDTYTFEVSNDCGSQIRTIELVNTPPFVIIPDFTCVGENGSLSVEGNPTLSYEWTKDSDPNTVLSTSNTLSFMPLEQNDLGGYSVRLISGDCIDEILTYTIDVENCDPCEDVVVEVASVSATSACVSESVNINIEATPNAIITLDVPGIGMFDEVVSESGSLNVVVTGAAGDYTVTVVSISLDGCEGDAGQSADFTILTDSDGDGVCDIDDECPMDPDKTEEGSCGCGVADTDSDGDGVLDCNDNCPDEPNPDQNDSNENGVGDACEEVEDEVCGDGIDNDGDGSIDEPENLNTQYEWIESIVYNDIDNTSGNDNGYGDYSDISTDVVAGETSYMVATAGYASSAYSERWTVYIDLDQDGIFSYPEELVGYESGKWDETIAIHIPSSALPGTTLMRVYMRYGEWGFPCDDDFEGEVEDYTVNISSVCDNLTDGGSIGEDEELCGDQNDPAEIVSTSLPSGGSGDIEYMWLKSTYTSNPPNNSNMSLWSVISGADGPSYDPGTISQTTWYIRCARRSGCTQYLGESNVVQKTYDNTCGNDYCESEGESTQYEWIHKVKIGSIYNCSGNDGGYGDYTEYNTHVTAGNYHKITLYPGYANNCYNEYWRVWVDWNQDGDFDDSGELEVHQKKQNAFYSYITVPNNALLGQTRMRVSMSYQGYPNPCDSFSYGEVEDYTITVMENNCSVAFIDQQAMETIPVILQDAQNEIEAIERNEAQTSIGVNVYPVPVTDKLYVQLSDYIGQPAVLTIIDSNGKSLLTTNVNKVNGTERIDVTQLVAGQYYLIAQIENELPITKPIIVVR